MKPSPVEANAKKVNRYVKAKVGGKPEDLYEAAGHLIVHGGKRLRPYMAVRSCQLLGGAESDAMPAAGAVEMIHNFTLVHDDIMDNDDMRHGVQTVHKRFGTPVAILAGDVLYSKAYQDHCRLWNATAGDCRAGFKGLPRRAWTYARASFWT